MFAAGMLVAGQAGDGYEEKLEQLADQTFWFICSEEDARACPGMMAIAEAIAPTEVTVAQWSARLPDEEQEALAAAQEQQTSNVYWTIYDAATVMRDDVSVSDATEHMNTWRVAYDLNTVREWLFKQQN